MSFYSDAILLLKSGECLYALGIISNDLAYVLGIGRYGGYAVAVEYDEKGNELFRYSGYLLKKE